MIEKPENDRLQRAIRTGFAGIMLVCIGILWVFLRSDAGMFGVAEAVTVVGMLMIMGAAWMAAEATADEDM